MNSGGLKIEIANIEDSKEILQITKKSFIEYSNLCNSKNIDALSEQEEDVCYDIQNNTVIKAICNENIVGAARIKYLSDDTAYLYRFAVDENMQGIGVGSKILLYIEKILKSKSIKKLELHTCVDITGLVDFYKNNGFIIKSVNTDKGYNRALMIKEII